MVLNPLISVITITYNAESSIAATLDSVVSQSFGDYEHILIDGSSTDATLAIARKYNHLRILSEKDSGLYDAMNKGLAMARGRYVIFLNAGDSFHSDTTLEKYAERALMGDDIIYGDTVIVDSHRHIIGRRHLTAPRRLTADSFKKGMLICHQAFMVRRELAPQYDLHYRFSADYDWTVKCIKAADPDKCTNLGIIAVDYLSDGLTDRNKLTSLRERYKIMQRHYGGVTTFINHIRFLFRAIGRKIR